MKSTLEKGYNKTLDYTKMNVRMCMYGYVDNIISCKKTLQFILYFKIEINACMHHHHHKHTHIHTHFSHYYYILFKWRPAKTFIQFRKLLWRLLSAYTFAYTHSQRETHVRPRNNMLEMSKDGFMMTNK